MQHSAVASMKEAFSFGAGVLIGVVRAVFVPNLPRASTFSVQIKTFRCVGLLGLESGTSSLSGKHDTLQEVSRV